MLLQEFLAAPQSSRLRVEPTYVALLVGLLEVLHCSQLLACCKAEGSWFFIRVNETDCVGRWRTLPYVFSMSH